MSVRKQNKKPRPKKSTVKRRWGFARLNTNRLLIWLRRGGIITAAVVLVLWLGSWVWFSGMYSQATTAMKSGFVDLTADAGFRVDNILVEGRNNISRQEILSRLGFDKGDPLLSVDPDRVLARLDDISWLKTANLQIRYPDTVYIRIQERAPLAIWHDGAGLSVIDGEGVVLTKNSLARFAHLPVVTGNDANRNALELITLLRAEPVVFERLEAAAFIGKRRWDLKLENGLIIHLPEDDIGLSLRRLAREQNRKQLLDKDILSIDTRYEDRLIIKTKPGAVQTIRTRMPTKDQTNI